jgi:hypothetical protein
MVVLVPLLQPLKNGNGGVDARLLDVDLVKPPHERGVLLDVLAALRECRGTDAAGWPRPCCRYCSRRRRGACASRRKRAQPCRRRPQPPDHLLDALLEHAAVLGPGHHGADVELHDTRAGEGRPDGPGGDPLREALGDGGLAYAGLAHQHGAVLGPAAERADDAVDLVVAADHRVRLAGRGGHVPAVRVKAALLSGLLVAGEKRLHICAPGGGARIWRRRNRREGEVPHPRPCRGRIRAGRIGRYRCAGRRGPGITPTFVWTSHNSMEEEDAPELSVAGWAHLSGQNPGRILRATFSF